MTAVAPAPAAVPRTEPESRGRTVIADRVVERIATRAASEPGPVTGPGGGLPGLRGSAARPRVTASVRGRVATVRVALGVTYPAPVRAITRRVREQVRARVREMTGIDVRQVDIAVARLPEEQERGRVR